MTEKLINKIALKYNKSQRDACSTLSGYTGIVCNAMLCAVKFAVGALTGAVSVTADAVNNLSDASVNIVTLAGSRLANKPVDKEHPFGHGRAEYVSALIVAFSILIMSFELGKSSVLKIIHPQDVKFSTAYLLLLLAAVGVKLWMALFNRKLYSLSENLNLKAVMKDSLSDCAATLSTIAALVLAGVFHIQRTDGIIGCAVAVFVFVSGISAVREILGPLLGEPPSKELVSQTEDIILNNELILGVHDIIFHSYGHGRIIASAHAEVPADADLITVHGVIDSAEREIAKKLNIDICIHTDPVETNDSEHDNYKVLTEIIIGEYNSDFSFHDFRLNVINGKTIISFDLVVPFEYESKKAQIKEELKEIYKEKLPEAELDINIEHSYTAD